VKVLSSSQAIRTILLRLEADDQLPESLAIGLEVEGVKAGWIRASGVLANVEVRAGDDVRKVAGLVMAVNVESVAYGGDELVLRGVFSRDTGASIETFAGEIVRARVVTLDALITVLDAAAVTPPPPVKKAAPPPTPAWTGAMDASARSPEPSPRPQPVLGPRTDPMPVPPPKIRKPDTDVDQAFPEAGDIVEHFAFGKCEVIKSDGDRLHVKLARDGRIREIALEMLKVVPIDPAEGHNRFRLDRRL
jgi:hypothetical protein